VQGNGLILAFSALAMVVVVGKLTDIIFIISLFRPPFPALAILCAHFGRWLAFQPPTHRLQAFAPPLQLAKKCIFKVHYCHG